LKQKQTVLENNVDNLQVVSSLPSENLLYEQGKLDKMWVEQYCMKDWNSCIRYQMEERSEPHPDCMLPNGVIDSSLCM